MAQKKTTYVRMADALRRRIEIIAQDERRSIGNMIAVLLEEALEAREKRQEVQM